jgi:hypothetical protein
MLAAVRAEAVRGFDMAIETVINVRHGQSPLKRRVVCIVHCVLTTSIWW